MGEGIKHNFRLRKGFTLIEMLVVLAVIAVISSLLIASYRTAQKRYALESAAQNLVSDLREVQAMAMSGAVKTTEIIYGYGVHFDENTSYYIIFADKQFNDRRYQSGADIQIEKINLADQIKIAAVSPNNSGLDIVFESPNPQTYINKNSAGPATVTLRYGSDVSLVKTVSVNSAGAIKIQ